MIKKGDGMMDWKLILRFGSLLLLVILSLTICNEPVSGAGRWRKEKPAPKEKRQVFLKKYRGVPVEGHLIQGVPFCKQENKNYCGPAALAMVLGYWQGKNELTQEKISSHIFKEDALITNNSDMVFYPREQAFVTYSFNGDMEQLKNIIKKDFPLIILQKVIGKINKGHYRVILGYDDNREIVIVNDPLIGEKYGISYKTFLDLWSFGTDLNRRNWTLLVLPSSKKEYLQEFPDSAVFHMNLATAFYNREQLDQAIKQWQKAIEIVPKDASAHYCIAYAYLKKEDYTRAVHYATRSVELDDSNSFCYDTLGWTYYKKGMTEKALELLEEAIKRKPKADFIQKHYEEVKQAVNSAKK